VSTLEGAAIAGAEEEGRHGLGRLARLDLVACLAIRAYQGCGPRRMGRRSVSRSLPGEFQTLRILNLLVILKKMA